MDDYELARKRASQYAPKPVHEPGFAGAIGFVASNAILVLFEGAAGIEWEGGTFFAHFGVVALVTFVCFWHYRSQERLHNAAYFREIQRLENLKKVGAREWKPKK